jgi:hypothetical protein
MSEMTVGGEIKTIATREGSRESSTGIYKNARGSLRVALEATPPFLRQGPYRGTIILAPAVQRA